MPTFLGSSAHSKLSNWIPSKAEALVTEVPTACEAVASNFRKFFFILAFVYQFGKPNVRNFHNFLSPFLVGTFYQSSWRVVPQSAFTMNLRQNFSD